MRLSASKAGLLPLCQFAFREGTRWDDSPPGVAAQKGNQFHDAVAALVDPDIQAQKMSGAKWLLDRLNKAATWLDAQDFPVAPEAEVAFAYDPTLGTSRRVGKNIGRKYRQAGKQDHEVAGTVDFLTVHGGTATVYDWKTGKAVTDSVWPQMEMLGLMVARAHKVERVVLRPLHVTDYGIEDGMVRELDAAALVSLAARISRDVASIADAWPEPGAHCDGEWCPARKFCAAYEMRKAG